MKIRISLSDDEHAWFKELNKEEQAAYIEQHPNSQFAKDAKAKEPTKVHEKVKSKVKDLVKSQHEFFHGKGHVAGSEPRRSMGKFLKDKLHGVMTGLKHEVKEFKTAGSALVQLASGKEINAHQKDAIKAVLVHALMVVGPMAVTGGLSAGLSAVLPHVAAGFLEHTLVIAAGRAAVFASDKPEDLMKQLVDKFADYVAEADLSEADWKTAFDAAQK